MLTVSVHHSSPGYFPGTGNLSNTTTNSNDNTNNNANGFALNLPLKEGLKDALFLQAFQKLCNGTAELYRPECIVMCCGVDGLANDPIGRAWSLTPAAYGAAASHVRSLGLPVLLLGGGGYDSAASCCAFAAALAGITNQTLPEDVPQHQYFDKYGPSYSLLHPGFTSLAPDFNSQGEVEAMCDSLLSMLSSAIEKKHTLEKQQKSNSSSGQQGGEGSIAARRVVSAKRMKLAAHQ